jgi:sirohydrochlorin ferrochelatase
MRNPHLRAADGRPVPARAWPPPLIAVAHGSRDPAAAEVITGLMEVTSARAHRAGLPGLTVRAAYLGHARPSVAEVLEALRGPAPGQPVAASPPARLSASQAPSGPSGGQQAAVVLPLLLTEAYHSGTDLPAVLGEISRDQPGLSLSYGAPLGPHRGLLRALERRLAEAGAPATRAPAAGTAVVLAAAGSSRPAANAAVARAARAWQSARGWRCVVPAYASAASPTPGEAVAALVQAGASRVVVATYLLAPGVFADQVREQALAAGAQAVSAPLGSAPEVAGVLLERYLQAVQMLEWEQGGSHDACDAACHA